VTMLDSTLDFFLRSFRLRNKELKREEALAAAADLTRFFAVELQYKGSPIRLIVAASAVPEDFQLNPRNETRELPASPSVVER
jgi:hypothetical protein